MALSKYGYFCFRIVAYRRYRLYGVTDIWGVQYGYEGFYSTKTPPRPLSADFVKNLHDIGGTVLGSSRGAQSLFLRIVERGFILSLSALLFVPPPPYQRVLAFTTTTRNVNSLL